jgi:flagellar hook-basal body complex protein FliE
MTVPIRPDAPFSIPVGGASAAPGGLETNPSGQSFSDLLSRGINNVSDLQDQSKDMIAAFLRGDPVELHQVMASSEEAGIAIDLLVQLRNKLTDAYRTVMSAQT